MGIKEYQDRKQAERNKEKTRQDEISSGKIEPIKTDYNLEKGEKVYATFSARKMGQVSQTITHKQGVGGRAGCGCCLLGPLGALLGGATAPSKSRDTQVNGTLDTGVMVFTNKRFLFVGKGSLVGLIYDKVLSTEFNKTFTGTNLVVKYPEMVSGEYYSLSGEDSKIAELWYQGITKNKSHNK